MSNSLTGRDTADRPTSGEPVECPFCGHVTVPNRLADASYVCSCPEAHALPIGEADEPGFMPPPVDDGSFVAPAPRRPAVMPEDHGQFGRDVATEDYKPLAPPPKG